MPTNDRAAATRRPEGTATLADVFPNTPWSGLGESGCGRILGGHVLKVEPVEVGRLAGGPPSPLSFRALLDGRVVELPDPSDIEGAKAILEHEASRA